MDKKEKEHETETSKNQTVHPEATSNADNQLMQDKILDYSASYSSSSSSSSNPLELDVHEKDLLENSFNKAEQSPTSPIPDLLSPSDISTTTPQWSMMSASPRGTPTASGLQPDVLAQEWAAINASPKQSPPVQVMGRPAGYDPNRIPSSVFCTKPTTPTDWSVASNESLFSIHMGNSSFSRDHSIMLKSGELIRTDDWSNSPYMVGESKSSDLNSLPTVIEAAGENGGKIASIEEESGEKEDIFETENVGPKSCAMGDDEKKKLPTSEGNNSSGTYSNTPAELSRNSASTPRLSDESGNSASSFAFQVLGGEGGSSKGNPEKVASQAEKRPETQTETESEQKKEQQEPQSPLETPKAAAGGNRWFSCFSCCPLCC